MPDDDTELNFELLDKNKLLSWLIKNELAAIAHAFTAKSHIAVKAYAQGAAFKYVYDNIIAGTFDLITDEDTVQ